MTVSCIRCTHRGTSLLTYDHAGAEAYLDDARGDEERYEGMVLCEAHAARFTPPRGWALVDRRRGDLSLFGSSEVG
jgi:nitrite reductase/ring-hydroxylating ferredoxin subunit